MDRCYSLNSSLGMLMYAGDLKAFKELLQHRYNPESLYNNDNSPIIHELCQLSFSEEILLKFIKILVKSISLHYSENSEEIIASLLDTRSISDDVSAVQLALIHGKPVIFTQRLLKRFLELGGDPGVLTRRNMNLLHLASRKNYAVMVMLCKHFGTDINGKDMDGNTPLHLAVGDGNYFVIVLLIALKAKLNIFNDENETPLHIAAKNGNYRVCRQLLLNGADKNLKNSEGKAPKDFLGLSKGLSEMLVGYK